MSRRDTLGRPVPGRPLLRPDGAPSLTRSGARVRSGSAGTQDGRRAASGSARDVRGSGGMAAENCVFCAIVEGSVPADIVHRDGDVVAFRDIAPKAPVHILVVPREHIASLDDTDAGAESVLGRLVGAARDLARSEGLAQDGYRVVVNNGAAAGQSVDHLHVHVLGGRDLGWPPG